MLKNPQSLAYKIFTESNYIFFKIEGDHIATDISERNLCGRFAIYLTQKLNEHRLKGYFADTEYNRKQGGKVKTILDEEMNIISIQSDLIVHSRGMFIKNDNIIAIEFKKSTRPERERVSDRKRLRAMTKDSFDDIWPLDDKSHPEHVCGYALGVYIILDVTNRGYLLEYYQKGIKTNEETGTF